MAKTKKIQPSNDEDSSGAETVRFDGGDGRKKVKKQKKPKKAALNVVKVSKAKKPSTKEMVTKALIQLKSRQGCSLAAIRNFIESNYAIDMNKQRQTLIKKVMMEEYAAGRLMMTNHDKLEINFTKRFNIKNKRF